MTGRRVVAGLGLAACALVAAAPAASAQVQVVVALDDGWWWSVQPDPPVLPSPTTVPADGLRVSSSPAGESSVTALRVAVVPSVRAESVTLRIASQRGLAADALAAFPTAATFEDDIRAGSGADAPAPIDGAAALPVAVDVGAGTVTVALDALTSPAAFVLQAAPATGGLPRDLEATFEAVTPADVSTVPATTAGPATVLPPPAPAPEVQAAPEFQDGFVLPAAPMAAAQAPPLPGIVAPEPAPAPAVAAPAALLPDPLAGARPFVPSSAITGAVTRSRTLGLLAVGLAALLVLAQQARPRRARLSLHGLPAPGAEAPVSAARAARLKPPRLR